MNVVATNESGLPRFRDPRCRIRRKGVRLKRHVGPETDNMRKARIVTTAALMQSVVASAR